MRKIVTEPYDLQQPCLQSWFTGIQHLPGSVLLHSGNTDHENARYHIAATDPVLTLTLHASGEIRHAFQRQDSEFFDTEKLKPLNAILAQVLEKARFGVEILEMANEIQDKLFEPHEPADSNLPFLFGGIGYATYDFGRFLEVLPENAPDTYESPIFSISFYTWSLITDRLTTQTWLCFSEQYGAPDLRLLAALHSENRAPDCSFRLSSDWRSNMTQSEYVAKLDDIHEYLLAGDCYQVNLAQRFQADYQGCEWQAWQALQAANQSPFSAFIRTPKSCILSLSPERFLATKKGQVETKPIKGTRPRFPEPKKDAESKLELLTSEKDRAENLMIVDLLRNDLSKNALPHSVKVEKLFDIESFQAVHHLVSTVKATLKPGVSPITLMKDAFPGGSITGAPKVRAMEIIDELEPQRRNIYCGSIFYYGIRDDFDSNICIRTLLLENQKIYCWAGGGIVADSQAQLEYEETFHKVNKILPVLAQMQ